MSEPAIEDVEVYFAVDGGLDEAADVLSKYCGPVQFERVENGIGSDADYVYLITFSDSSLQILNRIYPQLAMQKPLIFSSDTEVGDANVMLGCAGEFTAAEETAAMLRIAKRLGSSRTCIVLGEDPAEPVVYDSRVK